MQIHKSDSANNNYLNPVTQGQTLTVKKNKPIDMCRIRPLSLWYGYNPTLKFPCRV